MFRRWLDASLILLAVACGSVGVTAHADDDYSHALATAPQGILRHKTTAILAVAPASKSSATVVDTDNPEAPGTQAAVVTNAPNQFGSIWSTNENDFDLTKNETMSMWLYFGNQGTAADNGMAFVLQNDSQRTLAMPAWGSDGISAETLGVWGVTADPLQDTAAGIAATAIQNSWALEFDTNFNDGAGGQANAFDVGQPPVHIASNYPGDAESYARVKDTTFSSDPSAATFRVRHNGLISEATQSNFLANGSWHHLTLSWNARASTMTYTFNDKNPVTEESTPGVSRTVRIDLNKVDPNHTGRALWGFTGATDNRYENNLVVLESAPGLVSASTTASLTDLTQDKNVDNDDDVLSQDRVRLNYQLDYQAGRQSWSGITGRLRLPTDIAYDKYATITYANGTTTRISTQDLTNDKVTAYLKDPLSATDSHATLSLTGRAVAVDSLKHVAATTSIFASNAFVGTAETPTFTVTPHVNLDLAVTSANPLVLTDKWQTTVAGKIGGFTSANVPPALSVTAELNGTTLPKVTPQRDGTFALPLTASQLQSGTNLLKLTATSADGDTSKTVTVMITVTGELKFDTVSSEESFQISTLTGNSQRVGRSGDWQLVVQDTRGTGSRWTLNAQATPFTTSDGQQLAGQPVYVTTHGSIPIEATPTPVLTHVTDDSENDGRFDVAGSWTAKTGMLLAVNNGSAVGNYSGTITWTLSDAPS
ncbi:WxL domain-containing protein [Levilactobacillus fujinensis]|uniref:WxL domain-containing protein n=1 Tax=Levilactobacillus fujinensis TaxID=2486024 RepID=A0ABW1TI72_9LACO|nr:WxL domain-containing protein [Levilactobacillus fujinensis]